MPSEDTYDRVGAQLATWLQETPRKVARRWMGEDSAPFAAKTTQRQLLEYYDRQFFLPNGEPNVAGRAEELERIGVAGYAEALRRVMRMRDTGMATEDEDRPAVIRPATKREDEEGAY